MAAPRAVAGWLTVERQAGDLEGQIHRAVRERILSGRLRTGQRLPASRALAHALGVSRSTVVSAFDRLRAEGFLETSAGAATRVARLSAPPQRARAAAPASPASEPEGLSAALRPGIPDLASFPHALWARCLAARTRSLRVHDLGYGEAAGLGALRAAILAHATATRGVAAGPDQVLVLPSAAAAIDLVARLRLGGPGESVAWIEEPGYPVAQSILRQAGARLVPVPVDAAGMDPAGCEGGAPGIVYVTPSHQYPTGATMTLPRRLALLEAAQRLGATIIEDDYDSEYHYRSRPIAALQGIDRGDCVAYVGTFSKVLAPGLRVAYAILPPSLVERARAAQRLCGTLVPIHVQAALADFMEEGHLRAHIRRMGILYAERMALTRKALEEGDDLIEIGAGHGGLQLAAWFRDPTIDDRAVVQALDAAGFGVRTLSEFHLGPPRSGLLFGIAAATPDEAAAAVRIVRQACAGRRRGRLAPDGRMT